MAENRFRIINKKGIFSHSECTEERGLVFIEIRRSNCSCDILLYRYIYTNILNHYPQNPHVDHKEQETAEPEARDKGAFAEEFELVALVEPERL